MPHPVAFTIAFGREAGLAARALRATFQAHNPGVPFLLVDEEFLPFFTRQPGFAYPGEITALRAVVGYFLSLSFPRVVWLDADILVLAPLTRLVDGPDPVVLTRDTASADPLHLSPEINVGALAAADPGFWRSWMTAAYSFVVPPLGAFFDQYSLRLLCRQPGFVHRLLPDDGDGDHYNVTYRDHPGEWRREGDAVFKGDARVRLWHWAGAGGKAAFDRLPDPVLQAARAGGVLERPPSSDNPLLANLLPRMRPFHGLLREAFRHLPTTFFEGFAYNKPLPHPGLFISDLPAAWDAFRPDEPGVHRRLLPRAPRYVYAHDPERLRQPDVDALDVSWSPAS